jgi:prevent-host-death family protein
MQPHIVTQKDVNNHYKKVFDMVRDTKRPAIVTVHKHPQIAIITMEDYAELENIKQQQSTQTLLDLAQQVRQLLKQETLPKDLAEQHDTYLWEDTR